MIYQIITIDCGMLASSRTFQDGQKALHALSQSLDFYREKYAKDENNAEENNKIFVDDESMECTFILKNGDIRVYFMLGEIE